MKAPDTSDFLLRVANVIGVDSLLRFKRCVDAFSRDDSLALVIKDGLFSQPSG